MKFFKSKQVRKRLKKTGIVLLVFAVGLTSLHLFVVYRARQILNYIVMQASDGQYTIKSKKVHFRYNPLSINASGLNLVPVNADSLTTFYTVTADSVSLQITKLLPLITNKNFTIGNIAIIKPAVKVFDKDTTATIKKPLNVVLADMQHTLVTTLSAFSVEKCMIEDARFTYQQNSVDNKLLYVNHIYLNIENLHTVRQKNRFDTVIDFKADVRLFIDRPDIQLPDTSKDVYIQNLLLDTRNNIFSVNRFNMYSRNNKGTTDSINLSNIKLRHFNWNRWLTDGLIEIDSVKAYNGATFFDFSDKELFSFKNNPTSQKARQVNVPLIIHNVEINKIAYALKTGSPSGPLMIQLQGDSLGVGEISIGKDVLRPLQIGNLAFKVTGYTNNYDNNRNESTFEKLIIDHNNLELVNFYRSLNTRGMGAGSSITIPSLKVINFSLDDLLRYRLKADRLLLNKPSLVIDIQRSEKKRDADATVAAITKSLQPSLEIDQLSIQDAAIILIPKQKASGKITIDNLNTEIDAKKLLASKTVMDIISSATDLSTSGFHVTGDNVNLEVQRSALNNTKDGIYLERITGNIGPAVQLDLKGVSINDKSNRFDITRLQSIDLDYVNVEGGKVTVHVNHSPGGQPTNKKTPAFNIENIHTGPLAFEWLDGDKKLSINDINFSGYRIAIANRICSWQTVDINTGSANFKTPGIAINASSLLVKEPGLIKAYQVNLLPVQTGLVSNISIPMLSMETALHSTAVHKLNADKVIAYKPAINLTSPVIKANKKLWSLPDFYIKELLVDQPAFTLNMRDSIHDINNSISTDSGRLTFTNVSSNKLNAIVTAEALHLQLYQPKLELSKKIYTPEQLKINARNLSFNAGTSKLEAMIDSAELSHMSLHLEDKSATEIIAASAGFTNFLFSTASDSISLPYLVKHTNWWSSARSIKQQTKQHTLTIYNPTVAAETPLFSIDSLSLVPLLDRDSFWRSTAVEKDYNTLRLGYTQLRNWKLSGDAKERKLTADYLLTDRLNFLTEKDKTHGPDTVSYRPLLANSFKKIPLLFEIDTVQVTNGFVRHNLLPEKSKKQATVFFADINGYLYNVKNNNYHSTDSLRFRLGTRLMGQGDLLVGFRQSYTDSLQAFTMRARMGRMDLSLLNTLLVPLVSIKIDRGIVDSMLLIVGANDYIAFGSMDMRYHNLRLSLLKDGERKYFLSSFSNWVINAVVHANGDASKNSLYQERLRNKGIYNYWSKIAIRGLLINLGVAREKKQLKKYKKAMKGKTMPEVAGDPL